MLTEVRPLHEDKELVKLMVKHVADHANTVCEVCGLGVMGHGPESQWLGYEKHDYTPIAADQEAIENSHRLTSKAYKIKNEQQEN